MKQTTVHFAGVNTEALCAATEGRAILVSYADVLRRPGWWTRSLLPRLEAGAYSSVILDSGAFTVLSAGLRIDVSDYARFAAEYGHLFDQVVGLDDIAGELSTTWRNQAELEAAGVDAMPVFHQGEPWAVLDHYLARYGAVGVGFARKPGGRLAHSQADNHAFLVEVFARRDACGRSVRLHGFAMTRWAEAGFAFDTTDSTTWIAEYRALSKIAPEGVTTVEGDHGVAGELADVLAWYGRREMLELALDSYAPGDGPELSADELEEWGTWIERDARGQARTVVRRYGAARLAAKVAALDARLCAEAA